MAQKILDLVLERFGMQTVLSSQNQCGDETVSIEPIALLDVVSFLKEDPEIKMNFLMDLTAVDWIEEEPRFELVYHFYSLEKKHRLRVKTRVGTFEQEPEIDSLTPFYRAANWMEREAFDLYGIQFVGHPNLIRILMYKEFSGHPLRKDYPIAKRQPLIGPKN